MQKQIPNMPCIIVLTEKHGQQHLNAPTKEKFFELCKEIVANRQEEGWYEFEEIDESDKPDEPVKPLEACPAWMHEAYEKELRNYRENLKDFESDMADKETLAKALQDGMTAWLFLEHRSEYEYEKFEVINAKDKYVA